MSGGTNIEWTERTWNPIVGCTKVSEGCRNCYAMGQARWMAGIADSAARDGKRVSPRMQAYREVVKRGDGGVPLPQWNNEVRCVPEALTEPLKWRTPRAVFVNSMSDMFHEAVPFEFVDRVFAVMALTPRHTYQVLTKRPERMAEYLVARADWGVRLGTIADQAEGIFYANKVPWCDVLMVREQSRWPLPNVWLGTSVENQAAADLRIPHLLRCPAAVRFLSCEPLLGPVDLGDIGPSSNEYPIRVDGQIQWVIVGGESGPGARPCNVAWVRSIVDECREAGVPVFVKQLGRFVVDRNDAGFDAEDWTEEDGTPVEKSAWPSSVLDVEPLDPMAYQGAPVRVRLSDAKGGDMSEWPMDLRVREMPARAIGGGA